MLLNQNERHAPLPAAVRAAIEEAWRPLDLHRYDEEVTLQLRQDLARTYNVPLDDIVITNGGDGGIEIITTAAASRVEQAIIPVPGFSVYHWAAAKAGLPIRQVPVSLTDGSLPVADLLAAADRPSLIYVCRPHNPTGDVPAVAQIEQLLAGLPAGSLIMIDEAYVEYGADSLLQWMQGRTDTTLMRTFSKALGLAGLRVGWSVIPEPWRQPAAAVTAPFAVANTAQAAASVVLRYLPELEAEAAIIAQRRQDLYRELQSLPGVTPSPGAGNFVLFQLAGGPSAAQQVAQALAKQNIFIRTYDQDAHIADCLRVSVGTDTEIEQFLAALKAALPTVPAGEGD